MKYSLIYGSIAGAVIIALIILTITVELPSHLQSEWFGYLVMLLGLTMIFVGVKRYRDVERGGVIRFGPALALGLGMAAVASVIYVIVWEIFLATSGTDFMAQYMADYTARMVQDMRADGASVDAIQAKVAEIGEMGEAYKNPLFRLPFTFAEIAPVGIIVAFVSALILRNPRVLPARAG